jgi:predicted XRE-type DNA-binding protein
MTKVRAQPGVLVERGSGNVYADLGYKDSEAMLVKARLVTEISDTVRKLGLTQVEAARRLKLTQPKVSALMQGRFRGVSEQKLLSCLTRLGKDVQIVVRRAARSQESGRLSVRIA